MDAFTADRQPHSIETEQALLGCILVNNEAYSRVAPFLEADHFYDPLHGSIYSLCSKRIASGKVADPKTLKAFLDDKELAPGMTTSDYIARMAMEASSLFLAEDYGRLIHELAIRRALIGVAMDTETIARDAPPDEPIGKLLEEIETRFAEIRQSAKIASHDLGMGNAVSAAMERAQAAYQHQKPVGWPWVLPELEQVMDGPLEPGNLYGLLGASGDGKTSIILQQMRFSAESGIPCLFLSGEQSQVQCVWQMVGQARDIEAARIKEGRISAEEADALIEEGEAIRKLPMAIQKWQDMPVAGLAVRIRSFVKRYGPGIIAIDHAKKIRPANPKGMFAEEVFNSYSALKDVMAETECAGILLMQRNSAFLDRRIMRPIRGDVYGGEGPLQNLDGCLALFRPDRWIKEALNTAEGKQRERLEGELEASKHRADFYGLKARGGEDGRSARVRFKARFTRFESLRSTDAEGLPF